MRIVSVSISAAAFIIAGFASYFMAGVTASWIEDISAKAVEKRLVLEGFSWASVQTNGLEVILEGEAPSEARRFNALAAAGAVVEAARVIDNFTIQDKGPLIAPKFLVEILRNDTSISIIGLIPTSSGKKDLMKRISRIANNLSVADFLETADYPAPKNWSSAISFSLLALERLERSKISVGQDMVKIEAIGDSPEQKAKLRAELVRRTPSNITSQILISAPRPVITPFTLKFRINAQGAMFDACSAGSIDDEDLILNAAREAGLKGSRGCRQGLGSPSPKWGYAAALSIKALKTIGQGSVALSDADISLTAIAGTDPILFEKVTGQLESDLPGVFALQKTLLVELDDNGGQGPPSMVATLSPEGQVQVRGPVLDGLTQSTLKSFAHATFGTKDVLLATKIRETLPAGWSVRTMVSLAALNELNSGIVEVSPNLISISGLTGNKATSTKISQILLDRIGNSALFELDITYLKELDPLARLLDQNECLQEVKGLIKSNKITFEPSSTTLDQNSQKTIVAISEVFSRCAEAPIEIGGHTDSQGREEMNLNLSQSRADSVLNALRSAKVKMKTLTSIGYGESTPIAENTTEEGREANRRIEFSLIKPVASSIGLSTKAEEASNE
ncbi:MAG: OmpA family protein [Planktomarina sp.]|nr:OmpA family protein [Planktomarina sp.]